MKKYRVKEKDLRKGAVHEMEHTKNPRVARRIARDHLREHPTYYKFLPVAEKMMQQREKKMGVKPIRKKRAAPFDPMNPLNLWIPRY